MSDGAGSASHGGEGAALVCRSFSTSACKHLLSTASLPSETDAAHWLDQTRDLISTVADRHSLKSRDFAATLIFVVSSGANTMIFHIGDGCAVVRDAATAEWTAPVWPAHGEYISTTSFVTDEVPPVAQFAQLDTPISAVSVFSDGLERLVLDLQSRQPHARFFERMIKPVERYDGLGRNASLSKDLREFLNGGEINQRTDDDKSLILAAFRE